MKRILIAAIVIATSIAPPAHAADCIEKACIEVYTQDGHIVIEGRKGKGPASTKVVIPAPSKSSTPHPKATKKIVVPVPTVKTSKKPTVKKIPRKPKVKKSSTSATSLQDKLVESIPTAGISYQPSFSPLVKMSSKIILVDAVFCLVDENGNINTELKNYLDSLSNRKIVLTNEIGRAHV